MLQTQHLPWTEIHLCLSSVQDIQLCNTPTGFCQKESPSQLLRIEWHLVVSSFVHHWQIKISQKSLKFGFVSGAAPRSHFSEEPHVLDSHTDIKAHSATCGRRMKICAWNSNKPILIHTNWKILVEYRLYRTPQVLKVMHKWDPSSHINPFSVAALLLKGFLGKTFPRAALGIIPTWAPGCARRREDPNRQINPSCTHRGSALSHLGHSITPLQKCQWFVFWEGLQHKTVFNWRLHT